MSKVFKRPMFRKGGEVGGGIMTGIRQNFAEAGSATEQLMEVAEKYPSQALDPLTQFLIQGGLNLASQPSTGGGIIADIATAAKEPTAQLMTGLSEKGNFMRDLALAGTKMDIEQKSALEVAKAKALADAAYQKDYTPDRKYYELVKDRTAAAAALKSFEKRNIDLQFPRGTSRFDAYYANNLIESQNPVAIDIKSNFDKFVPYDDKTGQLKYDEMIPGMYYFDPDREVYIQSVPKSDEDEGGYFIVNPSTFEKRKLER